MSMKRLGAVIMLLVMCSASCAVQNLNSATGYVQLPDASVVPKGSAELSAAYVRSEGTSELEGLGIPMVCTGDGWNVRLLGGLSDRFEIGAGFLGVNKDLGDAQAWTIGAKYRFYESADGSAGLAVGTAYRNWSSDMRIPLMLGAWWDIELPSVFTAYLVLDKTWPQDDESGWVPKTSFGLMYDHFSAARQSLSMLVANGEFAIPMGPGGSVASEDFFRPLFGVSIAKAGLSFIAEYKPRMQPHGFFYAKDVWTLAIRKSIPGRWAATLGFTDFNLPYTDADPGFFLDLSYQFGK